MGSGSFDWRRSRWQIIQTGTNKDETDTAIWQWNFMNIQQEPPNFLIAKSTETVLKSCDFRTASGISTAI